MDDSVGRRVQRSLTDRWLGGVAGGLAAHLGAPTWVIRLAFLGTAPIGGIGIAAYALMWVFLPIQAEPATRPEPGPSSPLDFTGILGLLALGLGVLLGLASVGVPVRFSVWGPIMVLGSGVILLWRQSDDLQRASIRRRAGAGAQATAGLSERQGLIRVVVGLVLVLLGITAMLGPRLNLAVAGASVAAAGAVASGIVLIALPWIAAWLKGIQAQRYAAVRAQERAEMAARVHDSVLQTLTLIQRRADDPVEVVRLARTEERALRSWLYAPVGPAGSLGAALADLVATTESDHATRIELVTVGDTLMDDRMVALLAATGEAVVNAAKHAGAPATVYAEVDDEGVEVYVRDRGRGFDPDDIGPDRLGIRASILARMAAAGGSASVRSVPGEGTEIRLVLPVLGGGGARG